MPRFRFAHAVCLLLCFATAATADDQAGVEFFEAKIRPVLVEHCYSCHSASSDKVQGGLLLDTRDVMRKGGDSGPSVSPNSVDDSLIVSAMKYESFEMPPKGKLPESVVADFEKWINMGAPDPREGTVEVVTPSIDFDEASKFWAFQPPQQVALPEVNDQAWPRNEIDHFILRQLEQSKLKPVRMANRRELIRRATFDLLGLPPTPEEVSAFVADESPDAYTQLIDRLLASPHYGERWGRYWLDVARYAEDQGPHVCGQAQHRGVALSSMGDRSSQRRPSLRSVHPDADCR